MKIVFNEEDLKEMCLLRVATQNEPPHIPGKWTARHDYTEITVQWSPDKLPKNKASDEPSESVLVAMAANAYGDEPPAKDGLQGGEM